MQICGLDLLGGGVYAVYAAGCVQQRLPAQVREVGSSFQGQSLAWNPTTGDVSGPFQGSVVEQGFLGTQTRAMHGEVNPVEQAFKTKATELLGIEHPIVQGGMMWISQPELVSSVSNAGALGILTALTFGDPKGLEKAIQKTHTLTDKPFGVNLTLLPTLAPTNYDAYIDVIIGEGVKIVETAGRSPQAYMEKLKGADITVVHKCTGVRFAKKAESLGCDMVSIDGCECAGHPGEEDITSLILIPATADAINIPIIASGGFADARGLVAALSLGAEGINMGTRFMATKEAPLHGNIKDWLVESSEVDTMYVLRSLRNTERVMKNPISAKVAEMESAGAGIEDLAPLISGQGGKKLMEEGDRDAGLFTAGLCIGLIHDIPTVQELIDTIVSEAKAIVSGRLDNVLVG